MSFPSVSVFVLVTGTIVGLLCFLGSPEIINATIGANNLDGINASEGSDDELPAIFDNLSNSVVQIVSITPPLFSLNLLALNTTEVGAGFIYADIGHIVTANHVLAGANNVSVVFEDRHGYDANVIGKDVFADTLC